MERQGGNARSVVLAELKKAVTVTVLWQTAGLLLFVAFTGWGGLAAAVMGTACFIIALALIPLLARAWR